MLRSIQGYEKNTLEMCGQLLPKVYKNMRKVENGILGMRNTLSGTYREVDEPLLEEDRLKDAMGRNLVFDIAQVLDLVVDASHLEHRQNLKKKNSKTLGQRCPRTFKFL
jgi:hypothetical protein